MNQSLKWTIIPPMVLLILLIVMPLVFASTTEELYYIGLNDLNGSKEINASINTLHGNQYAVNASVSYPTYNVEGSGAPYSAKFKSTVFSNITFENPSSFKTISFWIKGAPGGGEKGIFHIRKTDVSLESIKGDLSFGYLNSDSLDIKFHNRGDTADPGNKDSWSFATTYNKNNWVHIALTTNGTHVKTYINGTLANTRDLTVAKANGNTPLYFAHNSIGPLVLGKAYGFTGLPDSGYWNGSIDEVRIYNTTLTSEQINAIYNYTNYVTIDDCSTYKTTTINITIYNETDTTLILNGEIRGIFIIQYINYFGELTFSNFTFSWSPNLNSSHICIDPASAVYNIFSAQLEYWSPDFSKKTYYLTNFNINNITQSLNLYLTNDTTQVQFSVIDQDDNPVDNVYINILSYDFGTNTYKTTEILKTDSDGISYGQVVLDSKWYKFMLVKDGTTIQVTEPTKIIGTSKTFRVGLTTDYFYKFDTALGIESTPITFNNATRKFSWTFNDPSGRTTRFCLTVDRYIGSKRTQYNESCVTSSSGTLIVGIVPDTTDKTTWIATAYIDITGSPTNTYALEFLEWVDGSRKEFFGGEGVFVTFLLLLTLAMIGVAIGQPIISVVMVVIGIVVVSMIESIFFLSTTALIAFIILGGIVIYKLSQK